MTVAIAIKAIGGTVIATDRQQTEGALKVNWGKMSTQWIAERGSLTISGAGNGSYLDAIGLQIGDWFRNDSNAPARAGGLEQEIQKRHEEFYRNYVLPFESYADYERPDYELLIAASPLRSPDCLWTSHKLIVNREQDFAAVGSGATVARALLDKFHIPGIPIDIAVNLAAYVLWQVKQTVDGVGFETDLLEVRRGRIPLIVPRDEIAEMEAQFKSYEKLEAAYLYHCLGGNLSPAQRSWGLEDDDDLRKKAIRLFFERLNEKRNAKYRPKPLDSQPPESEK